MSLWNKLVTSRIIYDIYGKKDYLRRWSLWLPFGISLKVHQIVKTDDDRCEHDHPWWFIRFILWGGYTEQIDGKFVQRKPWRPWTFWRVYPCWSSFRHRITYLPRGESWSFVICGKTKGTWGFYTRKGYMSWEKFLKAVTTKRVMWCDDGKRLDK